MDFTELWHHVSTFDEPVKTELMNTMKYALISLPVIVAGVEGIKALKPRTEDPDREKSTGESLALVIGMLVGIVIVLFAADRVATFFVPDGDYRVIAHMVLFLVIADQSVGASIRNLVREWTGREGMENIGEESQPNPNPNATLSTIQAQPQQQPRPPPVHQAPMDRNNQPPPVQQELNTMMSHDMEPMAASEFGGAGGMGSAWQKGECLPLRPPATRAIWV
jgi:preprotein translocase subunit SecE